MLCAYNFFMHSKVFVEYKVYLQTVRLRSYVDVLSGIMIITSCGSALLAFRIIRIHQDMMLCSKASVSNKKYIPPKINYIPLTFSLHCSAEPRSFDVCIHFIEPRAQSVMFRNPEWVKYISLFECVGQSSTNLNVERSMQQKNKTSACGWMEVQW